MTDPVPARTGLRTADCLGAYILPGGVPDPSVGIAEGRAIESAGLGTAWIGERFDTKDVPALAGALSQVTQRVRIAAGITPFGIRHPMVLASMGQTLQSLTGGRFMQGLGRSAEWRWRMYGIRPPTLASMGDTAGILRRLWAGETVTYSGPAGEFPELRLAQRVMQPPPPLLLAAVGPKTLQLAGTAFDGAILHPFLTPAAVRRSVDLVRGAAKAAGRDPSALRIVATVVTAPDRSPAETDLAIRARGAGYFQVKGLGDMLVESNGWSTEDLERYRAQPMLAALAGKPADKLLSRADLIECTRAMPDHWMASASAAGTAAQCAAMLHDYLDAGADEILLHGSTAEHVGDMAAAFTAARRPWQA